MAFTLDATVGGQNANSYETVDDAQNYFDSRLPLSGWDSPVGGTDQGVLLAMATRTLDALAQPFKTFFPAEGGSPAYYRVRRQWTGARATPTQKLAFPRTGLVDFNGNALDIAIAGISIAAAAVVTTQAPHRRQVGDVVLFYGTLSTPSLDGQQTVASVIDQYNFTVAVTTTGAGIAAGGMSWIPDDLKWATAEFAGQLGLGDRTLDNDVIVQGITSIRAGSVGLGFKNAIIPQVIPDAVYNLLPQSWLTDELYLMANQAVFEVGSENPNRITDRHHSEGWW